MRLRNTIVAVLFLLAIPVPPVFSQADSAEVAFWESVRDSQNPAEFEAYLKAFPDGTFASLARIRIEAINSTTSRGNSKQPEADAGPSGPSATDAAESPTEAQDEKDEELTLTAKLRKTEVSGQSRTLLGVRISGLADLAEDLRSCFDLEVKKGVLVTDVTSDSAAEAAGIKHGDIIRRFEGTAVDTASSVAQLVAAQPSGVIVNLEIVRPRTLRDRAKQLRERAGADEVDAMACLARLHQSGLVVERNLNLASRWFRRAAEAGHAGSMNSHGINLENGTGVTKDVADANRWYRKAAELGNAVAMFNLARNLENGSGITKDQKRANQWYRKAAEADNSWAMNALGVNLEYGTGTTQDKAEANLWYRSAAELGNATAMFNLGRNFANGNGVAKDMAEAARWHQEAIESGNLNSVPFLAKQYDTGSGVERDQKRAAKMIYDALKAGNDSTAQLMSSSNKSVPFPNISRDHPLNVFFKNVPADWSRIFRFELQRLLQEAGYYNGKIDGDLGSGTKRAIAALHAEAEQQIAKAQQAGSGGRQKAPATPPSGDLGDLKDLETLD